MDFFKVKCQLLIVYFVGFGCQPTILLHTMRQSFEPSYTRIQALLVFFLSFALASQPFSFRRKPVVILEFSEKPCFKDKITRMMS